VSAVAPNPKTVAAHEALLEHERVLWGQGLSMVAGLDEAGAGPWAGPVTAGCVVLDPTKTDALLGVNDSKKLNEEKRETYAELIEANVLGFAVASATVEEIDKHNIRIAGLLAMRRAYEAVVDQLGVADHLLIDARSLPELRRPQTNLIKGDSLSLSIAAASILAKVCRDRVMVDADREYPGYGFGGHKGYGTPVHAEALERLGPTPLHRRSFAPVRAIVEPSTQISLF